MALLRFLMVLLTFASTLGSAAAQESPAGRWALTADNRPIAILELAREPGSGRWTGAWIRPERLGISQMHEVLEVGGPVVRKAVLSAVERQNMVELTIEGSAAGQPGRHSLRTIGRDHAEFGWADPMAIPPIPLVRVDAAVSVAADWPSGRKLTITTPRPSNAEMKAIFEADQADRQPASGQIDWAAVTPRDEARRARTMDLLNSGALKSGDDFWHAAFVFQHGSEAKSYLLAHTLAMIAVARGRPDATWIAAATLDRYLQSVGQPQVYGTQFSNRDGNGWTQEPYDRTLVSDALLAALGVPAQAQQAERVRQMEERRRAQSAK